MSDLDSLISQIPLSQVAAVLGVDEKTAREAVNAAVPALVGGLGANAQDPQGEASLADALQQHAGRQETSIFDIDQQDEQDGEKIVRHVFGSNTDQVVNQLAGARGALSSGMLMKLLPLLAPIVMQWLAKQWSHRSAGSAGSASSSRTTGGVGQAPAGFPTNNNASGATRPETQAPSGGGLGDLLGSILGGSGGGLGDLLGGLLGGGRR